MENVVVVNGIIYTIPKMSTETIEAYHERIWFVANNIGKKSIEELIRLSRVWVNITFLGCGYSKNLMNKINELNC